MKSIKAFLIAILVIPALGLILFGPRSEFQLPDNRIVVVDYWEKWTGDEAMQMQQIVDEFNNTVGKEKNIYVRYVSASSITQKTLVATAAGVPPDIAGLWDRDMVQFASLDALEPMDEMAAAHGITSATYKPVYWKACTYEGKLYGLISTPADVALHYNKRAIRESAPALRAAGFDPDRLPETIDELDAWATILTKKDSNGRIQQAGYLPIEPGWYLAYTPLWFGGQIWDAKNEKFTLTDPKVVQAYQWIQSYSHRLGKEAMTGFKSGLGNFDSPQNAFLAGTVVMEQQGPWMANYIYNLKPGLSTVKWPREVEMTKPLAERRENYEWGAAAFPSAVPGLKDVTYAGFDILLIPRGAKYKKEAFEFIAYINRQDVMEKLCKLHCKNSPLANVSDDFLNNHPNPYINVFERLANSPNAHGVPQIPIFAEVMQELDTLTQSITQLRADPETGLAAAQVRLQAKYDQYMKRQRLRRATQR
ncbi:MAG: extracellular solute-binding protein [Burkholderiales bacterium]|nr:extracellular solute-binding protein [Phycisphaerae bacterium]